MSPVDDIILKGNVPPKKKGKGLLVVIFLLFIILVGLCAAYWYYVNYLQETPKQAFLKYIGQTNVGNILDTEIYYTMLEKMTNNSFKADVTTDFTTTMKNDFTNSVDVSKLKFLLNATSNKENEATLFDAKITYSSNDIFDLKVVSNKDYVGIGSTEILPQYIASAKTELSNSINRTTGIETDIDAENIDDEFNNFSNNRVNLTDEYKKAKIAEYSNLLLEKIPDDAVTQNESDNVVVTINSKTINTKAYTLSLDSAKYKELLTAVLTNLKNDNELISKIVTGNESNTVVDTEDDATQENINPLPSVQVDYTEGDTEEHQTSTEADTSNENSVSEENFGELEQVTDLPDEILVREGENEEEAESSVDGELPDDTVSANGDFNFEGFDDMDEIQTSELFENLIQALILGTKINTTEEALIDDINAELENIANLNEGVKITVYVKNEEGEEKQTVKVVAELPNKTTIDIEYPSAISFKVTYLQEIDGSMTGNSYEFERNFSDIKTKLKINLNKIEGKKVVEKTQIELETEGTKSSNSYKNDAIIKYNDSEGEFKVNLKNTIDFENTEVTETLTDENTIFVDRLSDEEATALYTEVFAKIMEVYNEKITNLAFIDNNSSSSVVEQPDFENEAMSKEEIKQKLIDTVSTMMGEAQANEELFTVENLADLKIDGLNVSSVINEGVATIKINGYTFKIDSNFTLTEE